MEATESAVAEDRVPVETTRIRRMEPDGAASESVRADEPARRRLLARFVRTGTISGASGLHAGLAGRLPALVHQVVHQEGLRTPYPIVLDPEGDPILSTLTEFLAPMVESIGAEGEEGDLMRHFAQRMEAAIRTQDLPAVSLVDAWKSARGMVAGSLRANRIAAFDTFANAVQVGFPKTARLLPCEPATVSAYAGVHAARVAHGRGAALIDEAARLRESLGSLLDVERDEGTHDADHLRNATGGALTDAFDFSALSHLLDEAPHAAGMDPERRARIEELVSVLDQASSIFEPVVAPSLGVASRTMDSLTARFVELLRTLETARLETRNRYRPEIHRDLVEAFVPEALSLDDLASCPPVLVMADAASMSAVDVATALSLAVDRRPFVLLLTLRGSTEVPGNLAAGLPGSAMSLGRANVLQSALSDVTGWTTGIDAVVASPRPAIVAVYAGPDSSRPYMTAAVARDGRAVPSFLYLAENASPWADRLTVDANDQPETDWPVGRLTIEGEGERDVRFTWLDYAATEPAFEDGFVPLAPADEVDGLVAADVFLAMTPGERAHAIPFIWTVTQEGLLEKTVVSGALVERAEAALDRWRRLRELGGIENSYAARAESAAQKRFARERDEALTNAELMHAAEMDRAVSALAESIVANIAAGLLDMESGTPVASRTVRTAAPKPKAPGTEEPAAAEPATEAAVSEPEEEAISLDEAYIETPRCTSCNECTNLNKMIFAYNGEKQAFIKDASAGPFRDLVTAAEKCPVRIIHPGKPTNMSEQGIDDLIERAKPFL